MGTLHEINADSSTVALENVTQMGTEGRKGNPAEEIEASDHVYEYIVFRGSDVKDLRIEETTKPQAPKAMPADPAILSQVSSLFFTVRCPSPRSKTATMTQLSRGEL